MKKLQWNPFYPTNTIITKDNNSYCPEHAEIAIIRDKDITLGYYLVRQLKEMVLVDITGTLLVDPKYKFDTIHDAKQFCENHWQEAREE